MFGVGKSWALGNPCKVYGVRADIRFPLSEWHPRIDPQIEPRIDLQIDLQIDPRIDAQIDLQIDLVIVIVIAIVGWMFSELY